MRLPILGGMFLAFAVIAFFIGAREHWQIFGLGFLIGGGIWGFIRYKRAQANRV
jgi:hypothetical protein